MASLAGIPTTLCLLTFNDRLTMDRLEQFLASSQFRETPVELLTLSACETASGDDRAALGLAREWPLRQGCGAL